MLTQPYSNFSGSIHVHTEPGLLRDKKWSHEGHTEPDELQSQKYLRTRAQTISDSLNPNPLLCKMVFKKTGSSVRMAASNGGAIPVQNET
jgi:hypothetical protein